MSFGYIAVPNKNMMLLLRSAASEFEAKRIFDICRVNCLELYLIDRREEFALERRVYPLHNGPVTLVCAGCFKEKHVHNIGSITPMLSAFCGKTQYGVFVHEANLMCEEMGRQRLALLEKLHGRN
jgi:hypothetical protein